MKDLKKKKTIKAIVVSNKMQGAVKVKVVSRRTHPVYKKVVDTRKYYLASAKGDYNVGDEVTLVASRPRSKNIRWVVVNKEE